MLKNVALLLCFSALAVAGAEPPSRPNVLVIYTDDQSYRTVGCYPESWPWVRTPNIDALAKLGVRFRGAYLGSWCMPSRASFLTGRQPHGIQSMKMAGKYPGSSYDPAQCPFWPAVFRKSGYHTAHIGKWHTGTDTGFRRDWDHQIVWNRPAHPENASAYYSRQLLTIDGQDRWVEGYPADNYTQWAVDYINGANRDRGKPWLLWLCYGNVHGPSKPAPRHKGTYGQAAVPEPADLLGPWPGKPDYLRDTLAWRRTPDGQIVARGSEEVANPSTQFADWVRQVNECVPAIDEGVGRLLEALRTSGQLENTLIIFTSDQGFAMGEHGLRMKVAPYDASYRAPLIVALKGTAKTGGVCRHVANAGDLVATIFALAGVTPPTEPFALHGRDLSPLLRDPDTDWPHPCLYEHTGEHYGDDIERLLIQSPQKAAFQKVPWYTAVVRLGWKYVRYLQDDVPEELYDLTSDPDELKNLAGQADHAEKLSELRAALAAELVRTQAAKRLLPAK